MFFKRNLPLIICFVSGLLFSIIFYSPSVLAAEILNKGSNSFTIISSVAVIFGCIYTCVYHMDKVRRLEEGFGFSIVLVLSFVISFAVGVMDKAESIEDGRLTAFGWYFIYIYLPLSATMFSLLGFFIASAAFRAFRIRNFLGAVLFLAATFVILGRIPFINDMYKGIFPAGTDVTAPSDMVAWIIQNPVMAAQRAIFIGVTLGIIVTSFKTIFGIDKSWLGRE